MTHKDKWRIYFTSVCAMRLHPRNDPRGDGDEYDRYLASQISLAAHVATTMMKVEEAAWQAGSQLAQQYSET